MREEIRLALGLMLAAMLTLPVGAQVMVDQVELTDQEGWIAQGVSYITLRGLNRAMEGTELFWDGSTSTATLTGEGFTLVAPLGETYILINDRAIYVEGGVWAPDGQTTLTLRLLADALEGRVLWDGETKTASLETGRLDPQRVSYDETDLYWLSRIISAESRGEVLEGQIAVGNVVLNRVDCIRYPDNIYGVIFDRNYGVQFEPISNGTVYDSPTELSIIAAKLAMEGTSIVGEALYFFAPALSSGTWIRQNTTYLTTIGCHQFYID